MLLFYVISVIAIIIIMGIEDILRAFCIIISLYIFYNFYYHQIISFTIAISIHTALCIVNALHSV